MAQPQEATATNGARRNSGDLPSQAESSVITMPRQPTQRPTLTDFDVQGKNVSEHMARMSKELKELHEEYVKLGHVYLKERAGCITKMCNMCDSTIMRSAFSAWRHTKEEQQTENKAQGMEQHMVACEGRMERQHLHQKHNWEQKRKETVQLYEAKYAQMQANHKAQMQALEEMLTNALKQHEERRQAAILNTEVLDALKGKLNTLETEMRQKTAIASAPIPNPDTALNTLSKDQLHQMLRSLDPTYVPPLGRLMHHDAVLHGSAGTARYVQSQHPSFRLLPQSSPNRIPGSTARTLSHSRMASPRAPQIDSPRAPQPGAAAAK